MSSARHPPSPVALASQLRREEVARRLDHQRRCRALPPPDGAEISRMVAEYGARGGQVTRCPAAYVVPVQNNTGPVADATSGPAAEATSGPAAEATPVTGPAPVDVLPHRAAA